VTGIQRLNAMSLFGRGWCGVMSAYSLAVIACLFLIGRSEILPTTCSSIKVVLQNSSIRIQVVLQNEKKYRTSIVKLNKTLHSMLIILSKTNTII
jgi:hypothetical protein